MGKGSNASKNTRAREDAAKRKKNDGKGGGGAKAMEVRKGGHSAVEAMQREAAERERKKKEKEERQKAKEAKDAKKTSTGPPKAATKSKKNDQKESFLDAY